MEICGDVNSNKIYKILDFQFKFIKSFNQIFSTIFENPIFLDIGNYK